MSTISTTVTTTVIVGSDAYPSPLTITDTGVVAPTASGLEGVYENGGSYSLANYGNISGAVGGTGGTCEMNASRITGGNGGTGSTTGGAGGGGRGSLGGRRSAPDFREPLSSLLVRGFIHDGRRRLPSRWRSSRAWRRSGGSSWRRCPRRGRARRARGAEHPLRALPEHDTRMSEAMIG
jgi:hypothetical protein